MNDTVRRMFAEANARLHDADILAQSLRARSDSYALLRILAFEVLLKCALVVAGQKPKATHNYRNLWRQLPGKARKAILAVAMARMPGHADLSNVEELLRWYQFIFEDVRYHYELYEGYTLKEQAELGELWLSLGAPTHEAVVQYHPNELTCLVAGLTAYVEPAV
jgi:hypothetical protein